MSDEDKVTIRIYREFGWWRMTVVVERRDGKEVYSHSYYVRAEVAVNDGL